MENEVYMSGTGNDFIVSLYEKELTQIEIISIVGDALIPIDGVIFIEQLNSSTVKMHYFNNDGTPAELCVNGVRCAAKQSTCRWDYTYRASSGWQYRSFC